MNSKQVSEKAAKLLGGGTLRHTPADDKYVWVIDEDGSEIDLGSTLKEAWRNLDKYKKDATSKGK